MVDRCICFSKTFAELKSLALRHRLRDIASLQSVTAFGLRCGLCRPYVERMLETGRTAFPVIGAAVHPFEDPGMFGGEERDGTDSIPDPSSPSLSDD